MKFFSKLCISIGLVVMFSVLGVDLDQSKAAVSAILLLTVGYLAFALGMAIPAASAPARDIIELEGSHGSGR